MKRYETKEERIVTKTVCVELICDLCGVDSINPEEEVWGVNFGTYGKGRVQWQLKGGEHGEREAKECHLCYCCARWIGENLKEIGKLKDE